MSPVDWTTMIKLKKRANAISNLVSRSIPVTCKMWAPTYSEDMVLFRMKYKNREMFHARLTHQQVLEWDYEICASKIMKQLLNNIFGKI